MQSIVLSINDCASFHNDSSRFFAFRLNQLTTILAFCYFIEGALGLQLVPL